MFSQTGAEALRPRIPVSAVVATAWRGSWRTVAHVRENSIRGQGGTPGSGRRPSAMRESYTASYHLVRLHVCTQRVRQRKTEETSVPRDPWRDFWNAYDAIGPRVSLYKVWKGHVTGAEIAAGLISPLEAYGSDVADKLAERGAIRNAVSLEFVAGIRQTDLCVKLVQTRLIEANLLHDQNKPKFARAAAETPVRRGKFDPAHAKAHLNSIGHDFCRIEVG